MRIFTKQQYGAAFSLASLIIVTFGATLMSTKVNAMPSFPDKPVLRVVSVTPNHLALTLRRLVVILN
ncbi:hypothetical protein [Crenothrix polyspora]|uniref:hypothetical protein n=1 Tax=Crenothrix polyspora TaxID=360316 RepID=UPI000B35499A|nr:hypothetical protein [Crenothrix polyspora]